MVVAEAPLVIGAVGGYVLGQRSPTTHSTEARCALGVRSILCQPVDDDGSPDQDGWTYRVPVDVAWTGGGIEHESGRPECLPQNGELSDVVGLSWVDVTVDGRSWRAVVSVAC